MQQTKKQKKRKRLKPIEPKNSWSASLQKILEATIKDVIYEPLLTASQKLPEQNARQSAIARALKSGELAYVNGSFRAKKWKAAWSRELKQMGARWNKSIASWSLPIPRMTDEVAKAVRAEQQATEKLIQDFNGAIKEMPQAMADRVQTVDIKKHAKKTAANTSKEFKKTVIRPISVQPKLTPEERIFIDETYIETVTRPIKLALEDDYEDNVKESMFYFTQEETAKLRKMISEHVTAGRPRAELIEKIEDRLSVGYNRAKFIARQETKLFTAQLKQAQYQTAHLDEYEWQTIGDGRVRHDHKLLNDKRFRWDDPPIIDKKTGRRGHPGEDFNCRCLASPIVGE
jgi:SPP1 gp7 family putative phage head morphogenesis protein